MPSPRSEAASTALIPTASRWARRALVSTAASHWGRFHLRDRPPTTLVRARTPTSDPPRRTRLQARGHDRPGQLHERRQEGSPGPAGALARQGDLLGSDQAVALKRDARAK